MAQAIAYICDHAGELEVNPEGYFLLMLIAVPLPVPAVELVFRLRAEGSGPAKLSIFQKRGDKAALLLIFSGDGTILIKRAASAALRRGPTRWES